MSLSRSYKPKSCPALVANAKGISLAVRYPPASYWLGVVKEMAAINAILIIVNRLRG
jgi:hypothetical protein